MAKLSRDFSAGNLHPRENLYGSGTLGALNAALAIAADGCTSLAVSVAGTFSATLQVEASPDGTVWFPLAVRQMGGTSPQWTASITAGGAWWARLDGAAQQVRIRCTAYTSGAASVSIAGSVAVTSVEAMVRGSDRHDTATGAAGAAVTLTSASVAGLYQYFTRIIVSRFATTALTAGTTPVIVTSTNLSSRALSLPADAATQGTMFSEIFEPATPIRAQSSGTSVTLVAPATTGVIWRLSADYYLAP